jgi:hypothetical protein
MNEDNFKGKAADNMGVIKSNAQSEYILTHIYILMGLGFELVAFCLQKWLEPYLQSIVLWLFW